ncbi:hypothetical protein N9D52_03680 [Flavobacteriaceae bacterium]|nr:hypothetical protein [Flavobacteriaceae bacterium]
MRKAIVNTFNVVFSDKSRGLIEKITLWLSIAGFIVHLLLIYLNNLNVLNIAVDYKLLSNPISAIYTPFTFILIYEIYLLVLYLPRSFTTSLSKQFEIISLILIRRIFGDIPKVNLEADWISTQVNLNLIYDLLGVLMLYFLIYLFNKDREGIIIKPMSEKIERFVVSKKAISLVLLFCLLLMSGYSFFNWLFHITNSLIHVNINTIFYNDFFELLILADVFILLISFQYTEKYTQIIRNTGFIICTILMRLSFGTVGLTNVLLIISSVVFGLIILKIFNLSERITL